MVDRLADTSGPPGSSARTAWRRWLRWAAVALTAGALILAVGWVLFIPVADWIATHDVGNVTGALRSARLQMARDAARGRLLTLGAGFFAAGALVFTARNFTLARRMFELTDRGQRRTLELTEQGQVTDRYTRAIEQLGSDKLEVRIGGIYALGRIALDSRRDDPTVMEVLAAFIREHSRERWRLPEADAEPPANAPRPDVQAAITVIARRHHEHQETINLVGVNLSGADLLGANLQGANLAESDLRGTKMADSNLSDINLARADLTGANLIDSDLTSANLIGSDLTDAELARADLSRADLSRAILSHADLSEAILIHAKLPRAILAGAILTESNLTNAQLPRAELFDAHLIRTELSGANLAQADLVNAIVTSPNLSGADLTGAHLSKEASAPRGWERDPISGRLSRVGSAQSADDSPTTSTPPNTSQLT